jgi:Cdc6-like AAA superfamily ATPase
MDSVGFVRKRKGSDTGTAGEVPVPGSVSVTASDVSEVKAHLFKQLREPIGTTSSGSDSAPGSSSSGSSSSSGRLSVEETKMKTILDSCFQEKVSGSVLVIGSAGSGKRQFADRILSAYKTPSGEAVKVARLQGLAFTKDNHALISLAKQVGIFADTDNFNMSVEALQSHFQVKIVDMVVFVCMYLCVLKSHNAFHNTIVQQSRLQSVPTVILIEDIDEFTKGSRQVLLYTLFDLMHRNDLYFVVSNRGSQSIMKSSAHGVMF